MLGTIIGDVAGSTRTEHNVKTEEFEMVPDSIRGSMMAGAAGDALGYPVEFMSRSAILAMYGAQGITRFEMDRGSGKALVSDDTQMTLFTACSMLMGLTRGYMRGIGGRPEAYVRRGYMDWYYTQTGKGKSDSKHTWIRDLPELAHRRAPGTTQWTLPKSDSGSGGIAK